MVLPVGEEPWYARIPALLDRYRDALKARRRRAVRSAVRVAGSRAAAVFALAVLVLAAWTLADVTFGRSPGSRRADPPPTVPPTTPAWPPIEPAGVVAAGPVPQEQPAPRANTPAQDSSGPAASEAPAPPQSTPGATPSTPLPRSPAPSAPPKTTATPDAPTRPTAYAHQYNLLIRSAPTQRSGLVAAVPNDTPLGLLCHTTGPSVVSFTGRSTTTWAKVTAPTGKTGYVSDGWILTPDDVTALVPAC
ncbi:hypothetical protein GCM10023205_13760 [Yinghuangia aomiensis]|uniref:SH3 domain-containing protein n=1 Tax=Yinghuangia aomiensis TaxID=676205 RepID=A0ABP9GWL9_9ACTN